MNIKKITAAFMSCVLACCAMVSPANISVGHISAEAYAGSENPCNKQDDMEVVYDRKSWIQPQEWNCPTIDPKQYDGALMIYFDKIGLEPEKSSGTVQRIYVSIANAPQAVSMMKFHVFYDTRLKVKVASNNGVVSPGKAVKEFTTGSSLVKDGEIVFYAYSDKDIVLDRGSLFTIDFILPEYPDRGEVYPIGMSYVDDGIAYDTFMNSARDDAGKLQMAYVFTRAITNGYIYMKGEKRIKGDVNEDEIVNNKDFLTLVRIVLGLDEDVSPRASDLNKDGKADVQDLMVLKKMLLA